MRSILLAAAGTSVWDEERRLQGGRSLPLSALGRDQVRRVAHQLAEMPVRVIYTGSSLHCRESAEILGEGRRARIRVLGDLGEVDQGLWEGLRFDELERQYARAYRTWLHNPSAVRPPAGETIEQAYGRARAAVARLARRHRRGLVVVVAPRLFGALLQCCLRGLDDVWVVYREETNWELLAVPEDLLGKA